MQPRALACACECEYVCVCVCAGQQGYRGAEAGVITRV